MRAALRVLAGAAALASLALAGWLWRDWQTIGFPDGGRTGLDRAHELVYPAYAVLSIVIAIWLARAAWTGRRPGHALIAAALALAGALAIEVGLGARLDHGGGG